ncbi:DUF4276 family protein [Acidithiobacillus montserratensis]|uniref:DUF4276 family protein n=1 Tax=Acidithiobacillus montserratensis TaxID=2729135 RepID=A0ACD5HF60_9PROT|nr:DUF4276 family protein [Acidithiobacillus montserratensis]MBN2680285.1 DUF4276 family protein [Acidithiobacillaceae bacterium]MBU2748898.1 DUF4276 family protein [Acidithiobacillus montserratensis]
MKRAYLLVEGQTEETFVRELLAPHYARMNIFLTAIIASTSPGHKGGVVSYAKLRPQIEQLCKQDAAAVISTMFDLYALPNDFPGKNGAEWALQQNGADKAALIEREMAHDIGLRNFIPYIQVHEFEALLFVEPQRFTDWAEPSVVDTLTQVRTSTEPENINNDPLTAPSKRILAAMPAYQKPVHGPLIACDIGLDAMRAACPHFAQWLDRLDALNA